MEEQRSPVEQMEEIVSHEAINLAAEQTKAHAEMILLACLQDRPLVQGALMFKASNQGQEYLTGVAVAIGLTARNWGWVLADNGSLDFTEYLDAEAEKSDVSADAYAHKWLREVMAVDDSVLEVDAIRQDMDAFTKRYGAHQLAQALIHYTELCAELLDTIMEIRNGDYAPEQDDSRDS